MASSNIKLFDENKGNMLSDSEFSISNQRLNGLQTGVASSQLQNKAMYQASLVAYAIAQIMLQNGLNANDTDAVSAFVANLSGTLLQKVHDIATTEEAQAGTATGKWMSPALVKAAIDTLAAKAQNILSDATKSRFGLSSDAVPNDMFAMFLPAMIIVHATPGSTVTCTKGEISLTAHKDGGKCTFYIPEYGEWTVSNGTDKEIVNVDAAKLYEVGYIQKVNYTFAYNHGDECIDVSGGWTGSVNRVSGSKTEVTTVNNSEIDMSDYVLLMYIASTGTTGASISANLIQIMSGNTDEKTIINTTGAASYNSTYDISGVSGNKKFRIFTSNSGESPAGGYSKEIDYLYQYIDRRGSIKVYNLTLLKSDDWETLASIAGISATSIDVVLQNSETLLDSKEAVIFMLKQCTGNFMGKAIHSSVFLNALGKSRYKNLVYANEHWAKFLAMV